MNSDNDSPLATVESGRDGLLLETSAQLLRLVGDEEMRREIDNIAGRFKQLGTSRFVIREFEVIIRGLYDCVERALRKLPGQDRTREVEELWSAANFELPPFVKGGQKLLSCLSAAIISNFRRSPVSARKVANWCAGQKQGALEFFYLIRGLDIRVTGSVIDRSTCCGWLGSRANQCGPEPHPDICQLKSLCVEGRDAFLSCLSTLAESDVSEADWISRNLSTLRQLHGYELLQFVGRHPDPLGDTIIFGEVPEGWDLLTRDRAFAILQRHHRPEMRVYFVRSPRYVVNRPCTIWLAQSSKSGQKIEGFLVNQSATGVAFLTKERLGDVGRRLFFSSEQFDDDQKGIIIRQPLNKGGWLHGVKIVKK